MGPDLHTWLNSAWEVLVLYLIPWGGGIPAGVLLAKTRGLHWAVSTVLYFISDVMLALVFEPLMLLFIARAKHSPRLTRFKDAFKAAFTKTVAVYGTDLGPLALVMIAFTADPMTGRSVAKAAGHGFFMGWAFAIAGDMIYFGVLLISTLWLNTILHDTTRTMTIMLVLMFVLPIIVRKIKERRERS